MRPRKRDTQDASTAAEQCARRLLEVVPRAMRLLREEMRAETGDALSVPQFRALAFLDRTPGASLTAVARFLGVADATASTMVERLVRRRLVKRDADPAERRRIVLALTVPGAALLERARARARARVTDRLRTLGDAELSQVASGLELLDRALGAPPSEGGRP